MNVLESVTVVLFSMVIRSSDISRALWTLLLATLKVLMPWFSKPIFGELSRGAGGLSSSSSFWGFGEELLSEFISISGKVLLFSSSVIGFVKLTLAQSKEKPASSSVVSTYITFLSFFGVFFGGFGDTAAFFLSLRLTFFFFFSFSFFSLSAFSFSFSFSFSYVIISQSLLLADLFLSLTTFWVRTLTELDILRCFFWGDRDGDSRVRLVSPAITKRKTTLIWYDVWKFSINCIDFVCSLEWSTSSDEMWVYLENTYLLPSWSSWFPSLSVGRLQTYF